MCRGALRPSSRLAPARPVSPPSCVRVYTPALPPACTRRPRAPAARARVGARPSLPPAAPSHLPGRGCLSLTRGVAPAPRRRPRARHNFPWSPTRAPHSCWDFRTPGRRVPRTRARRRTHPLRPLLRLCSPSFRRSSPLPTTPSVCRVSPPSGADPFSWSPTFAPQGAWKPGTLRGKPQPASCP